MCRIIGLGQNRQVGDGERRAARPVRRKSHHNDAVAFGFGGLHVAEQVADGGMTLGLQRRQREGDILGLNRAAVVEGDAVAQAKLVGAAVGGHRDLVCGVGVDGVGFVGGAPHHGGECLFHIERRIALEDESVERIESRGAPAGELAEGAALRGAGIDVFEVLEIGRIGEIAKCGKAVVRSAIGGQCHRCERGCACRDRAGAQDQDVTSRKVV